MSNIKQHHTKLNTMSEREQVMRIMKDTAGNPRKRDRLLKKLATKRKR